jgi:anaerobic ribonucleoside-triphosphate reductase activating protein
MSPDISWLYASSTDVWPEGNVLRRARVDPADMLRVSGVTEESCVDGPGLRYVVFTQGCPHCCPGCHNPETHAMGGGYFLDPQSVVEEIRQNPLLDGVTFSGGEPFLQPEGLCLAADGVKKLGKSVTVYTGYTFEHICRMAENNPAIGALLARTDLLVDGPYVERLRSLNLRFRGSSNQRMLNREDRINILKNINKIL